ncbi:MAG: hypothetical protein WBP10_13035 [Thermoanaerobaculia bacterium]
MIRATWAFALSLVMAGPAMTQNLLVNPGFDVSDQLAGWTCTTNNGVTTWSPDDRLVSPTSGSMQNDVTATDDNRNVRCSQCVPVNEQFGYIASTWFFWPDDADVSQQGSTRISFVFYSDADCTVIAGDGDVEIKAPILETWLHLESEEAVAPIGAVAARVFVFTWQNNANQPVRARLDDLDFSTTTRFRDGFESGDTSAWSSSVP